MQFVLAGLLSFIFAFLPFFAPIQGEWMMATIVLAVPLFLLLCAIFVKLNLGQVKCSVAVLIVTALFHKPLWFFVKFFVGEVFSNVKI